MTVASAVMLGVAVLLGGSLPWGVVLVPLNQRLLPIVPWAIVPMAIYLCAYWLFVGGRIGPADSAAMRRESLRARPLSVPVWGAALVTGLVGFAAILSLTAVMARLVALPAGEIPSSAGMPAATMIALLVMSSAVAGVTEEAAFRGYMQTPIERDHGLGVAILVNGAMFGVLHFPNHPEAVVPMLPYYIAVAAVYSGLTWATGSILPSVVLHVGGDIWSLVRLWATGRPEWQRDGGTQALVWQAGFDAAFWSEAGVLAGLAFGTFVLCRALRRLAARRPARPARPIAPLTVPPSD